MGSSSVSLSSAMESEVELDKEEQLGKYCVPQVIKEVSILINISGNIQHNTNEAEAVSLYCSVPLPGFEVRTPLDLGLQPTPMKVYLSHSRFARSADGGRRPRIWCSQQGHLSGILVGRRGLCGDRDSSSTVHIASGMCGPQSLVAVLLDQPGQRQRCSLMGESSSCFRQTLGNSCKATKILCDTCTIWPWPSKKEEK